MKPTPLYFTQLPIPNQNEARLALIKASTSSKTDWLTSYLLIFTALSLLLFLGHRYTSAQQNLVKLGCYVLLLTAITILFISLLKFSAQLEMRHHALDTCFNTYCNDPIHQTYFKHIAGYYQCLAKLKTLRFQLKYLPNYAQHDHQEEQWLSYLRKFGSAQDSIDIWHTPIGKRLHTHGFYHFYPIFAERLKLQDLFNVWLTNHEIRLFVIMLHYFKDSFTYTPKPIELKRRAIRLQQQLRQQEIELLAEIEQRFSYIQAQKLEREKAYHLFNHSYTSLMQNLANNTQDIRWKFP